MMERLNDVNKELKNKKNDGKKLQKKIGKKKDEIVGGIQRNSEDKSQKKDERTNLEYLKND